MPGVASFTHLPPYMTSVDGSGVTAFAAPLDAKSVKAALVRVLQP
jgi:hypothetical protein